MTEKKPQQGMPSGLKPRLHQPGQRPLGTRFHEADKYDRRDQNAADEAEIDRQLTALDDEEPSQHKQDPEA